MISITRIDDNKISAAWHIFQNPMDDKLRIICSVKLNGEENKIEFSIEPAIDEKDIVKQIHSRIIFKMAEILTYDLFEKYSKELWRKTF